AQEDSSLVLAGRHTKILVRLGVSPRAVGLYGPPIEMLFTSMRAPRCVTWNSFRRAPSRRRSIPTWDDGWGAPGVSFSSFVESFRNVTPSVRNPALTGSRISNRLGSSG